MVTSATIEPPTQRPSTICQVGTGESHVKWNVPDAHFGTEHGVADDERGDRHHEPEDAVGGDRRERTLRRSGHRVRRGARTTSAPAQGTSTANHRFRGKHDRSVYTRIATKRDAAARSGATVSIGAAVTGSAPGTGSRASRRARAPRATGPTRRARAGAARSRARGPGAVSITSPSRTVSNVDPADRVERDRERTRGGVRPSERTSTCRGRSSIASRIAWCPPAAASRPLMSTITRGASRSTSFRMCELTITVRPSAPSRWNSAMRCSRCTGSAPFRGSSSTSTCGSHTSAAATFVRWRMPLLKSSTDRSATSSMLDRLQRVVGRAPIGECRAGRRRNARTGAR